MWLLENLELHMWLAFVAYILFDWTQCLQIWSSVFCWIPFTLGYDNILLTPLTLVLAILFCFLALCYNYTVIHSSSLPWHYPLSCADSQSSLDLMGSKQQLWPLLGYYGWIFLLGLLTAFGSSLCFSIAHVDFSLEIYKSLYLTPLWTHWWPILFLI